MSTETKAATQYTPGPTINPKLREAVARQLGPEAEQKIHADAIRMSQSQGWAIEAGPITESILSPYMTVGYSISYFGGTFRLVQRVSENKAGYEEASNRARLIAAAPELLEALETIYFYFNRPDSSKEPGTMLGMIEAAIRKAKGEL